MLSESDKVWLAELYPGLHPVNLGVLGVIEFAATYDPALNQFLIRRGQDLPTDDSFTLNVSYKIEIKERTDTTYSNLPCVLVEGIDHSKDRHFTQKDSSACLCSPLAEAEFLEPKFDFKKFLEQLVIPFLYGQAYYSLHKKWPWKDLAHGAVGILESYEGSSESRELDKCIVMLKLDPKPWKRISRVTQKGMHLRETIQCVCGSGVRIGSCHPEALRGLILLRRDINRLRHKIE